MADLNLEALFAASLPPRLAALRRLLTHLGSNADDLLVWGKVGDTIDFLGAEARQVGFAEFVAITEAMGALPSSVRDGRVRVSSAHLQFLQILLEYLEALGTDRRTPVIGVIPVRRIREVVAQMDAREAFVLQDLPLSAQTSPGLDGNESPSTEVHQEESVTIPVERLDSLAGKLDSVIVHQFQLKKHSDLVQGLIEAAQSGDSAFLVKELQRLDQGLKEDINALDRVSFQFQEDLARFRMVPFQLEGDWKPLTESPKADVVVTNLGTPLERSLLKTIQGPLAELVRNALVHGIEDPETRRAAGKPPRGRVEIVCRHDRSSISIDVQDDGRGIDVEAIRRSAQRNFPMEIEELGIMPSGQLFGYLFRPGITTVNQKTAESSGNGRGLATVKEVLDELQGRVSVRSEVGKGSVFTLQFRASATLVQGFFVEAGGERFFVSSVFVKEIVIFSRSDLVDLPNGSGYRIRDLIIPVLPLASAFEGKESVPKPVEQMMVVELLGEVFGLVVDTIVRHAALSFKKLPDSLAQMPEIQGVVYDEKFNLVPILHIPTVLTHLRRLRSMEFQDRYSPDRLDFKNILVVDDGPTSRATIVQILRDAHYNVEAVGDGIEALTVLEAKHFHLLVCDDEMPRMDGPTLVENLRKRPEYAQLPVIALNGDRSGTFGSWKSQGISVFLDKANFSRQDLLDQAARLLRGSE